MKSFFVITIFVFLVIVIFTIETAHSGPTRVGNGDDGGDLESSVVVTSGILIETRDEAVNLLKQLNVPAVAGLGQLLPETEKAELLLVGRNVDLGKLNSSPEGRAEAAEVAKSIGALSEKFQPVYARTFPEPHAATRFFPAAMMLDRRQLVALHIHEALHRSLPKSLRENEKSVSRITLAIVSNGTSFDRIKEVVSGELRSGGETEAVVVENPSSIGRASIVEYGYRSYFLPEAQKSVAPVSSLHSLKSFLYPFESDSFGFGVEFTFVVLPQRSYLGPVGISSQLRLGMWGRSDIDIFGALHLNTLADGEIKNTPVGRDTASLGVAIHRESKLFRFENRIYFTGASDATQNIGGVEYTHRFGAIFGARVEALGRTVLSDESMLEWGGMGEVLLVNPREIIGGAQSEKSSRLRVVSVGPEFAYTNKDFRYSLNGRFIVDSTPGTSHDQIGDLIGNGVGQGSWGAAISWKF